jgi:diguanylate cyclase (GGDEF)-like protein
MGAADYIIKPFHFKELLARIINILRNRDHLKNLREENIRLQQLSIVDHLTGLYNKKYFLERLNEEVSRASRYKYPLACVMMDIDYFKRINDSYGHLAGDRILMDLADMIKESTRVVDVAARFGGEEFVYSFAPDQYRRGLYVAEKIRINIANHHFRDGEKRIRLSISAGVSCHTGSEDIVPESLIHQADVALYEAKNHGRNNTRLYRN